jgi:CBS domain-containing protein
MAERGFIALPVVDADGELIGMVTEADLMWHRPPAIPATAAPTRPTPRARGPGR